MQFRLLFAILAILMLPFASPLLSAKLRARIGLRWVILSLVVLLFVVPAVLTLPLKALLTSPYIRFTEQSQSFYSNLAQACGVVLEEHPLGTNEFIQIPVTDPSLPKAITDLTPIKIHVSTQGYWMLLVSDSRSGIGVSWEPHEDDTNVWSLHAIAESEDTVVYTSRWNTLPVK